MRHSTILAQAPVLDPPALAIAPGEILVGVPALDEERYIATCLRSLMTGPPAMRAVRVVVADGGSRDATREVVDALRAEFPNIELIDNPGRVQSAAMNRIVETCARPEHRVLVRCDGHAIYPPGYVLRVAESLMLRDAAALVVPMDAVGAAPFQQAAAWVVDTPLGSGGAPHRGGRRSGWVDHGHHAGIRLDWFRRIGGYDAGFSHNEDAELDHRLALAGGRIWLDAGIRIHYPMRGTLAALARQYWRYGRGRARTVLKHRLRPRLRQVLPVLTLGGLALGLLLAPLHPAFLFAPAGYLGLLLGASLWMTMRHRSACGLWAGPALAAMHLPWGAGFLAEATSHASQMARCRELPSPARTAESAAWANAFRSGKSASGSGGWKVSSTTPPADRANTSRAWLAKSISPHQP
jgi:succinoglycan biosynthesis protein ExoA